MFIILTIPSLINIFKNLPDSGRHVTSPYQGLFPADRRERRKELGYEVALTVDHLCMVPAQQCHQPCKSGRGVLGDDTTVEQVRI